MSTIGTMSAIGPTRTLCDVRLRAAVRGTADIKRALIRSALIISICPRRAISAAANQEPPAASRLGQKLPRGQLRDHQQGVLGGFLVTIPWRSSKPIHGHHDR